MKVDFAKLDRAFNPKVVAVIGDSAAGGFRWINGQKINGKVYSVQVNPESIQQVKAMGIENYTSVVDIPEPVDLAIVTVPRAVAARVLDDLIRKDVAAAHFFTAGFSETNTEEGKKLEKQIIERARQANFHLIGPNCMGIYNPKVGLRQHPVQYLGVSGPLGFISQSGTHAVTFSFESYLQGVYINKSVSFGNGIVLDSPDYLEYFGQDPEIKIIGMYLEGFRDGKRFLDVLGRVARIKPVIIWKGGRTEEGGRSIASHTGSLAVSQTIWNSAIKQCGAIQVADIDEMIDTMKALLYLKPVYGNRVGVAGGSGGESVAIADTFSEAGLKLPKLTKESYDELGSFFSLIGGAYVNPIDTGNMNRLQMARILDILERDANVDNLMLVMAMHMLTFGFVNQAQVDANINLLASIKEKSNKPVMAITSYTTPDEMKTAVEIMKEFQDDGVPAFFNDKRGAIALRNAFEYYRMKRQLAMQER